VPPLLGSWRERAALKSPPDPAHAKEIRWLERFHQPGQRLSFFLEHRFDLAQTLLPATMYYLIAVP
jgi:hypothetical protein